ncbi:MAG TPA: type II secretion system protein [Chthonomonadales bacterium]|nr:type II secretion system protein [Chthonomonadales bacterium]
MTEDVKMRAQAISKIGVRKSGCRAHGFTLLELLVATVFVGISVVGVMGGIRALTLTQIRATNVNLLQRLAMQKLNELGSVTSLNSADTSGDFSEYGYPTATWQITITPSGVQNIDSVKVTAAQGAASQSLTEMMYVRPTSTTGAQGSTMP